MTVAADAHRFAEDLMGGPMALSFTGWDGSRAGPSSGPTVAFRSPDALRYLLWSPGELGLARAYVTGALDVEGDLEEALAAVRAWGSGRPGLSVHLAARGLRMLARLGGVGRPLPQPASEARMHGRRHSRSRDARAISHHYDLSNDFYALLLDPSMAYSCGYWTSDTAGYGLGEAQEDKLEMICRKLRLSPGSRLLDVGCGWGSLAVHAARRHGAEVTAVTASAEQYAFTARRISEEGLGHLVDLRCCDYREALAVTDGGYDAVAAVEMGEHVGDEGYAAFVGGLRRALDDGGRLLLQVMSRRGRSPGGGPFIERYIAPDMHMRPLHRTLAHVERAGFEVRDVHSLREHYAATIRAWRHRLEQRWDEAVELIGEERARVWRLYLAGAADSFAGNRMGVDQILAVRTPTTGHSGMAPTRAGWEPGLLTAVR